MSLSDRRLHRIFIFSSRAIFRSLNSATCIRFGFVLFALVAFAQLAYPATFIVTKTADTNDGICDSDCSLREAIAAANLDASDDVIQFESVLFGQAQTILLSGGELQITNAGSLIINGTGSNLLAVSGDNTTHRVFHVTSGATFSLNDLKITGGNMTQNPGTGGGIYNNGGSLSIKRCLVKGNSANGGAGIASTGTLAISESEVSENTAALNGDGGGLYNSGTAEILDSTFTLNTGSSAGIRNLGMITITRSNISNNHGNGIKNDSGTLNLTDSTIASNSGTGVQSVFGGTATIMNSSITGNIGSGLGGGVYCTGNVSIRLSTISGNSANRGGGILSENGVVSVQNSRLTENNASSGGAIYIEGGQAIIDSTLIDHNTAGNLGGGFVNESDTAISLSNTSIINNTVNGSIRRGGGARIAGIANLTNVTISNNSATLGGGISTSGNTENVTLRNTIVANNEASDGGPDIDGSFTSLGFNLIEDTDRTTINGTTTGNIVDQEPGLDLLLRDNGGHTPTLALRADSPGIDSGDDCVLNTFENGGCLDEPIAADQRGIVRPLDGDGDSTARVDIGAFEVTAEESAIAPDQPDLVTLSDNGVDVSDNLTSLQDLSFDVSGLITGATVEFLRDGQLVNSLKAVGPTAQFSDIGRPLDVVNVYSVRQIVDDQRSIQSAGLTVVVDNTVPSVTLNKAFGQADPTRNQPIVYTAIFSEPVIGFDQSDISFNGSTADVGLAQVDVSGGPTVFTITVSNISTDGNVVVAIPANSCKDRVLFDNSLSTSTDNSVRYDSTSPTVTINQSATQSDPTRLIPIHFTVVFSEPVSGFTGADVTLEGSTANVSSATRTVTGSGSVFNVAINNVKSDGGNVVVGIPAIAAQDTAGNPSLDSTSIDNSVTVDNTAPTVTIDQSLGQADPAYSQPINFSVVFTEPVTGFGVSDVLFTGSTINTTSAIVGITGSGSFYNVAVGNLISDGGALTVSIPSGSVSDLLGNTNLASTSNDNSVTLRKAVLSDFDDDLKSDLSIWRPETGEWWVFYSGGGYQSKVWGEDGDKIAPADYDGDGKTDYAIWRPTAGEWWVFKSGGGYTSKAWGQDGDIPVPADYDADGKADYAIWRPSTGEWWVFKSGGGYTSKVWGQNGDVPVVADYDADGKADYAIWRPSTGEWWVFKSGGGYTSKVWGQAGDIAVPSDYDRDGEADYAIWRPSTGEWWVFNSGGGYNSKVWGQTGDIPVPADYDGDGKTDRAVWRPSDGMWWIYYSGGGYTSKAWGQTGDSPSPSAYLKLD